MSRVRIFIAMAIAAAGAAVAIVSAQEGGNLAPVVRQVDSFTPGQGSGVAAPPSSRDARSSLPSPTARDPGKSGFSAPARSPSGDSTQSSRRRSGNGNRIRPITSRPIEPTPPPPKEEPQPAPPTPAASLPEPGSTPIPPGPSPVGAGENAAPGANLPPPGSMLPSPGAAFSNVSEAANVLKPSGQTPAEQTPAGNTLPPGPSRGIVEPPPVEPPPAQTQPAQPEPMDPRAVGNPSPIPQPPGPNPLPSPPQPLNAQPAPAYSNNPNIQSTPPQPLGSPQPLTPYPTQPAVAERSMGAGAATAEPNMLRLSSEGFPNNNNYQNNPPPQNFPPFGSPPAPNETYPPGANPIGSINNSQSPRVASAAPTASAARRSGPLDSLPGPMLRVDTFGPKAVTLGENSKFYVNLQNLGQSTAHDIAVRVGVPVTVQLVSAKSEDGATQREDRPQGGERLIWTIDRLGAGESRRLALEVTPKENRPFDFEVDWTVLPIAGSSRIEVQQPQLQIALSGPREVFYGDSKIYSILLSNPGTGDAKDVSILLSLGANNQDSMKVGVIPAGGHRKLDVKVTALQEGTMELRG